MIGLIQRVSKAAVAVNDEVVGAIEQGILLFLGIECGDGEAQSVRLLERVLGYRVFPDGMGKMNLNLVEIKGGLLIVPQFTLPADTQKGMRPSFTRAAHPEHSHQLYKHFVAQARAQYRPVATGRFGERMAVTLCNDGPVTFWLQVAPK